MTNPRPQHFQQLSPLRFIFPVVCLIALAIMLFAPRPDHRKRDGTLMHGEAIVLTESNFAEKVLQSDKPVLVDFGAPWCGPCRQMEPIIDHLAVKYKDRIVVGTVNLDNSEELAARYQINAIPAFMFFDNGRPVPLWNARLTAEGQIPVRTDRWEGLRSAAEFEEQIEKLLSQRRTRTARASTPDRLGAGG